MFTLFTVEVNLLSNQFFSRNKSNEQIMEMSKLGKEKKKKEKSLKIVLLFKLRY